MNRYDIDNIPDDVHIRSWDTIVLPRPLLDLLRDVITIPGTVLIKRVFRGEQGMESLNAKRLDNRQTHDSYLENALMPCRHHVYSILSVIVHFLAKLLTWQPGQMQE
jgi:hypothetical protein